MKEQVLEVLQLVRPALQADGGDVELVEVTDDGIVSVKLKGACGSCPMATMTLMGVASPSAQGQAMINTETAAVMA